VTSATDGIKVTLYMSAELHAELKNAAKREEVSLSRLISQISRRYLTIQNENRENVEHRFPIPETLGEYQQEMGKMFIRNALIAANLHDEMRKKGIIKDLPAWPTTEETPQE